MCDVFTKRVTKCDKVLVFSRWKIFTVKFPKQIFEVIFDKKLNFFEVKNRNQLKFYIQFMEIFMKIFRNLYLFFE